MKLFFFGIDSATWDLIKPWVKQGKLPGFAKLLRQGSIYDLQSTVPPLTPVAWTSFYTGVNAGKHGIFDFYRFNRQRQLDIYLSTNNRAKTIFELLSDQRLRVCVANLPFTYPPRPVNGIMFSCFITPNLSSDFIYPQTLRQEFIHKFPHYRFTEQARYGYDQKTRSGFFQELIASIREKIRVFEWLEAKDNWNLFAINFMEVDHGQHWFWKEPVKLLRIYKAIDRYLLKKINERKFDQCLVFSDHGAGPYEQNLNLNTYFLQTGILKLKKNPTVWFKQLLFRLGFTPSFVAKSLLRLHRLPKSQEGRRKAQKIKLFLDLHDIDWERSLAFAFGYYGNIYLLKKNRNSRELVKQKLKELQFRGRPVIDRIWERRQVYHGPYIKQAPDLLYSARNYRFGSSAINPFLDNRVFSTPHTLKSGEHRPLGILGFYPKLKTQAKQVNIYDLSATILDLFGVKIPANFDGQSVLESEENLRGISI